MPKGKNKIGAFAINFPALPPCAMDARTLQRKNNNPLFRRDRSGGLRVCPGFGSAGTPARHKHILAVPGLTLIAIRGKQSLHFTNHSYS